MRDVPFFGFPFGGNVNLGNKLLLFVHVATGKIYFCIQVFSEAVEGDGGFSVQYSRDGAEFKAESYNGL